MTIQLYNNLTRQKEDFVPIAENEVKMYTCGPTVYDFAHIGNFRTYIFEDILRRYLKYRGYKVTQVMNLTDVDDKTIKGANAEKVPLVEYTAKYKKSFFDDLDALNIERAEFYPSATEHIKEMIAMIKILLEKGIAYKGADNSIYFSIAKFPDYGKLSKIQFDGLKAGARVSQDEYEKESASDFALWKSYCTDDGPVFWETELGKGRPGWHIECSAMSMKYLGPHFDIHTGGVDNIFPHHENEIAQSEAATGKKFVNYWLHSEHLLVDNKKMSKSLGNFFTLRDIMAKGYKGREVRYLLMSTHYRQKLNFTFTGLESARNTLKRIDDFTAKLNSIIQQQVKKPESIPDIALKPMILKVKADFRKDMDDDLNMSNALASIFDFMREMNKLDLSADEAQEVLDVMLDFNKVLGVITLRQESLDQEVQSLIREREQARKQKNFRRSDEIRDMLKAKGIVLEDSKDGNVTWKRI